MYKHRKQKRSNLNELQKALNTIDENTTIKIARKNEKAEITPGGVANEENRGNSEEACVPASQELTQRYLSQRSTFICSLTRTQSGNSTQRTANSYFELVLMKAGVDLMEEDNLVLPCDHVTFVGRFRELMIKARNYPDNVDTFRSGLREALAPQSQLRQKLLTGCTISPPGECVYQSQDSMIVNFLMIDFLCEHVLNELLTRINEAAGKEPHLDAQNDGLPVLPLMLAQLRYAPRSHSDHIFERIKEIYAGASASCKFDIIGSAEFILDANHHDDFVNMLIDKAPNSKSMFHPVTVQTLANLNLSSTMQGRLRIKILDYIRDGQCPQSALPGLIKVLLKVLNDNNDESAAELAKTLREIIIWRTTTECNTNEPDSQLEIFRSIKQALIRSKKLYQKWQKMIASLPPAEFRSVDLMILLLLLNIREDNALYIENLLRRRIKQDEINVDIIVECNARFAKVLAQQAKTLMMILQDFLREKHKTVADFAIASYSALFNICDSTQKSIISKLMQLTCDRNASHMRTLALTLLKDLQRKYPIDVQTWAMMFMPLLDRLSDMSLSQTRLVMELLCSIAYPAPTLNECPMLADQIDMIIKKQIINSIPFVKKQGIIGSVQLIYSIARVESTAPETDELDASFNTISSLPDGRGKVAANYIKRIESSTLRCAETLALFYDELASVCYTPPRANTAQLDWPFLIWFCELMTQTFQSTFIAEDTPAAIFGIAMSHQKCINSIEDCADQESELPPIAINIAELVLKPPSDAPSSIIVLAPIFNLVRSLHLSRYQGSLDAINALLGCAIVLPTFFDEPDSVFEGYEESLQKQILDIYYHCVNWLREVLSSFATQREKMIRIKVLKRLTDVILIEETIRRLLTRAPPDYVPPMSHFITATATSQHTIGKVAGRGRPVVTKASKGGKSKANTSEADGIDVSMITQGANATVRRLAAAGKRKVANKTINFDNAYGPQETYRQMDSNIMLILHETLKTEYPLPVADIGHFIGLLEFRFILVDIVSKLESVTGLQKCQSEQCLQFIAQPHNFIQDLATFLPIIAVNTNLLSKAIDTQLEGAQRVYGNPELFTENFNYLKVCFCLSLRLLAAVFTWSELADATQADLLKESLVSLLGKSHGLKSELRVQTTAALAVEVFSKFAGYETAIVHLNTAVYFYRFMVAIKRYSSASIGSDIQKKQAREIHTVCKKFLTRKWFNYDGALEKGATCNIYLDELVKGFLKNTGLVWQRKILRKLLEECRSLGTKDSALKSFPNFKRANFPLLFRGLCENVVSCLGDCIATSTCAGTDDKLEMWETSSELIILLLDIAKVLDELRNFQLFLKYSHQYLKMVLQHGMPLFEQTIRQSPERVSSLLKDIQITTRFLHNLCCQGKASKITGIVSLVPYVRQTVEALVFRVKALLAANKCASVFSMTVLKNRDLQGDDILSQAATFTSTTGENSEEEIPEDDMSIDETTVGTEDSTEGNETARSSSRSKCF